MIEEIYKKLLPYVQSKKHMKCFIIYHDEDPIGYIQGDPIKDYLRENQDFRLEAE